MNKTTKQALRAMKKDELVEFTNNLIAMYNVSQRERNFLEGIAKSRWERLDGEPQKCWDDRYWLLCKIGDWNDKVNKILETCFDVEDGKNIALSIWLSPDRSAELCANNWLIKTGDVNAEQVA